MNFEEKVKYLWVTTDNCKKKLEALGIPYGNVMGVAVNFRAKRRWGQTKRINGVFYINISDKLLSGSTQAGLEDTILHELLHTVPGCFNHGPRWKEYARMVNDAYGYKISRVSCASEKGLSDDEAYPVSDYKYVFKCSKCGGMVCRQRSSRFTRNYQIYHCGKCGGKFEKITV